MVISGMRAIRYHEHGEADVLTLEEIDEPSPRGNEVLIDIAAIGINHVDTLFREGIFTPPGLPAIPGSDAAGTVVEVGEQVTGYDTGDRVVCASLGGDRPGTYAEMTTAPVDRVAQLPDAVDFASAAGMGHVGTAAWQAVIHHGGLRPGETCLIHGGGGGLGHIAVQLAALTGGTVITTEADEATRERLADIGADAVFDYRRDDLEEAILSVGQPNLIVDYHFDNYTEFDIENIAHDGRVSILEYTTETDGRAQIPQSTLRAGILKDVTLQLIGIFNADVSAVLGRLAKLVANDDLHIEIADTYSLEEAPQAQHDIVEESIFGKLVIKV